MSKPRKGFWSDSLVGEGKNLLSSELAEGSRELSGVAAGLHVGEPSTTRKQLEKKEKSFII